MNPIQIIVTLGGIALSIIIAWFLWFAPTRQTLATATASGIQEVAVTVKGGYTPDIIVVKAGQPCECVSPARKRQLHGDAALSGAFIPLTTGGGWRGFVAVFLDAAHIVMIFGMVNPNVLA